MGLRTWLSSLWGSSSTATTVETTAASSSSSVEYVAVEQLALGACINLIATAISKCELKTYVSGKEVCGDEYYAWNVQPNVNYSSSEFWQKLIFQLCLRGEALVVDSDQGGLLVADSFSVREYAMLANIYSNVSCGDFSFSRTFAEPDVLHFRLPTAFQAQQVVTSLFSNYGKLIDAAAKSYRRGRGTHGTLTIDAIAANSPKYKDTLTSLLQTQFKTYFDADAAVLPLTPGYHYDEKAAGTGGETSRDLRALVDDVTDYTCRAFGIAPSLINGKVEGISDALKYTLTFCIDPLADMIEEEITRKRYTPAQYKAGSRVHLDTSCIQHMDVLEVAPQIDKLISSGIYSVNEVRNIIGEVRIDEDWADKHYITKNYTGIDAGKSSVTPAEGSDPSAGNVENPSGSKQA